MRLRELLNAYSIKIPLEGRNKREVIEEMIDLLVEAGKVKNRQEAINAVLEREHLLSTGVGDGVAIPHARIKGVDGLAVAFGRTALEIDYQALDDNPVRLIFMVLAPENSRGVHLKALSRISRMLSHADFRDYLLRAQSPAEVMETIDQQEKSLEIQEEGQITWGNSTNC